MESKTRSLKSFLSGKILFLGIGQSLKSDDAAGLVLLEKIKNSDFTRGLNAEFLSCASSPENYLERIAKSNFDTIIVIDALHMNREAGAIELICPKDISSFSVSTHSLSPRMFIDYLQQNNKINIRFLGVQPKATAFGEGLSPEVKASINKFVSELSSK